MLRYAEVNGARLAYETEGTDGPPIVFVSGASDDHTVWRDVLARLDPAPARLTYDRFGVGSSTKPPPGSTLTRTVGDAADELAALLAIAGVPTPRVVVGHSLGALITYVLAAHNPHACAGLILVDASDARTLSKRDRARTISDSPEIAYQWSAVADEVDAAPAPTVPAAVVAGAAGRWLREPDPENYVPFTLAEMDERWQDWQRSLARRLSTEVVAAPDAGHRVHQDDPGLVATAVDAVRQTDSNRP